MQMRKKGLITGAPQPEKLAKAPEMRTRMGKKRPPRRSIWNVKEGGVGIVADQDRLTEIGEDLNWPTLAQAEYARLKESGRWISAIVPLGSGNKQLLVQSFYGPQRSEEDPFKKSEREH